MTSPIDRTSTDGTSIDRTGTDETGPGLNDPSDIVTEVGLVLDGTPTVVHATPGSSLLRALRDAGRTETTGACEQGECGSCSVEIDGQVECACLVPALICEGSTVRTVRSIVRPDLASALAEHGAVQCGFCTPGIVVAAEAAMSEATPLDELSAREALAGNLCRCTGYQGIIDAVVSVDARRRAAVLDGADR